MKRFIIATASLLGFAVLAACTPPQATTTVCDRKSQEWVKFDTAADDCITVVTVSVKQVVTPEDPQPKPRPPKPPVCDTNCKPQPPIPPACPDNCGPETPNPPNNPKEDKVDDAPGGSEDNNGAENNGGNHDGMPDAPGRSGDNRQND